MRFATTLLLGGLAGGLVLAAGTAQAWEDGELLIWINGDKGYTGLQAVGDRFAEELGIPVRVEHPDQATDRFQQAASAGGGPDIFIWPHDRLGEWVDAGLLQPIDPSQAVQDDVVDFAWDAFRVDGQFWGYPIAVEAIGLIYNRDLVPEPPASFEEIPALNAALQEQGASALLWAYEVPYFTWPLLSANGGFAFQRNDDGSYDPAVTGVNTDGAVRGAEVMADLLNDGIIPRGATYAVMEAGVNDGSIAMMINGPWAWNGLRTSGIDFGVAPIPSIDGSTPRPFVGVLGAMLNASSPNADLAVEFLENYLLTVDGLRAVDDDVPLGAPASQAFFAELSDDPLIVATMANAEIGELMPNIPEMGRFWSSMEAAFQNIAAGRQAPREALDDAAERILQ